VAVCENGFRSLHKSQLNLQGQISFVLPVRPHVIAGQRILGVEMSFRLVRGKTLTEVIEARFDWLIAIVRL
jgi:hypothetical protein